MMDSIIMIDANWQVNLNDIEHLETITERNHITLYKSLWRQYQLVCVKKIKVTPKNYRYVQREYDIIKICVHPCVYQFYGACVEKTDMDEYVYFLFEYMENGNLLEYIRANSISWAQKQQIVRTIAIGMHYLFSRKPISIIHRDFKPENILVNRHGAVKIADFGISKQLLNEIDSPQSGSNSSNPLDPLTCTSIGTLRWTAPEILCPENGEATYTRLCDIYSLGLLIYFIYTEKVPYFEEYQNNGAKITYAKMKNIRPFLNDLEQGSMLYNVVSACTEKDPAKRPQSPEIIINNFF
jgi:serine/threonine protein kinase